MKRARKQRARLERRQKAFDEALERDAKWRALYRLGAVHRPGSLKK